MIDCEIRAVSFANIREDACTKEEAVTPPDQPQPQVQSGLKAR
jgi:hypothetical protein